MVPSPPEKLLAKVLSLDVSSVLAAAQSMVDAALRMPAGLAWCLLGAALLFVFLGRHSMRLIGGLAVAAVLTALSLVVLAPLWPGSMLPGLLAVVGGGAAVALGLAFPGLALGLAFAALFAWGGAWISTEVAQLGAQYGALPFGLLGFFFGFVNHKSLSVGLPPLVCAALLVAAAARLLAPASTGPLLPEAGQAAWALGAFGALVVLLLGLSLQRARLEELRAKKKALPSDAKLALEVKEQRARYEKFLGRSPEQTDRRG